MLSEISEFIEAVESQKFEPFEVRGSERFQ